jgi:hypothetical protein
VTGVTVHNRPRRLLNYMEGGNASSAIQAGFSPMPLAWVTAELIHESRTTAVCLVGVA